MKVPQLKSIALIVGLAALAGCASSTKPAPVVDRSPLRSTATAAGAEPAVEVPAGHYQIKKGDTLYSIALEHGQDYREVAAWNNLGDGSRINAGQVIRIVPPAGATGGAATGSAAAAEEPVVVVQPIVTEAVIERKALAGNSENLKREPRAGKEPYSDEALARAQQSVPVVASVEIKPELRPEAKPEVPAAKPVETTVVGEITWAWPASGKMITGFGESGGKGIDIGGKTGDPVTAAADGKVVYSGSGLRGYGQLVIVKHSEAYLTAYAHNHRILVKEGQSVTRGQKIAEMGNTDADQVKLHFEVRKQGKPVDPLKYLPGR